MIVAVAARSAGPRGRRDDAIRRLRDLLRTELLRGGYAEHRLPPEETLMRDYGASRGTVRDALELLRAEGLVARTQGVGTWATRRQHTTSLVESHGVVEPEPLSIWAGRMRADVLDRSLVTMPALVADRLGDRPGARCLRLDYIAWYDGTAFGTATNYVRMPEADALLRVPFETDWYALLLAAGIGVAESEFLIEATLADEHDTRLLGVAVGGPMFALEQVIRDGTGRAYDFALIRSRGDHTSFFSRARRPADPPAGSLPRAG
jgi:GntR family transcriptional regulator